MLEKLLKLKANLWFLILLFLVLANIIILVLLLSLREREFLVSFYDVGQGDAALIQTPSGYNILVDGGPNNKVSHYLNRDLPLNDRILDLVILTHPQSDHMYGLIEVIKKYEVKKVITSNVNHTTNDYQLWIDTLARENLKLEYVKAGQSITLSDQTTISFNWPVVSEEQKVNDLNKASLVFTLSYFDLDILMTGDADSQVQPYNEVRKSIEVLKVPHHGSKTSLTDSFLSEIKPKISIISVGTKNRYGHPRLELLKQLQSVGSEVLRTDEKGTIKIVSKGGKWYTQTEY